MFIPPSKHVLNAQVSIRAPCCKQWFDCAECHEETQDHRLKRTMEMVFICKKCKKAFRKDMSNYEESDEYCPHCDNHYVSRAFFFDRSGDGEWWLLMRRVTRFVQVIEAKTPQAVVGVEGDDARIDSR
ncbi:hypothetical protein F5J12DRAFT_856297 [Pisolithus orientalis]|uniref:uncharacterized protein n=1 Tax=Pisolithus orientalis TaxID=936130 RepID=UPI0022253FCF|nr:uncharacterized protein F5J12DRAFT_856297 [Pisolithus orientalis]KAI5995348.1 hypothetical protein F5J12DRAFT_856297 [Pisolithus orientalis]